MNITDDKLKKAIFGMMVPLTEGQLVNDNSLKGV